MIKDETNYTTKPKFNSEDFCMKGVFAVIDCVKDNKDTILVLYLWFQKLHRNQMTNRVST